MIPQKLRMKRAISPVEELQVRDYYNRTADSLGIPRPMTSEAWIRVAAHLREMVAEGYPPEWPSDLMRLHAMACSDLVMDTLPERTGPVQLFLSWILSPADRHGRFSELMRIIVLVSLSWLVGFVVMSVLHQFGWSVPSLKAVGFLSGGFLLLGGIFISSDTTVGATGLQCAIVGSCSFVSAIPDPHLVELVATVLGTLFGGLLFLRSLL